MLKDIHDIDNEEDPIERDKDQVDDGSCRPVNHFAKETHKTRLNAVRTSEGSGWKCRLNTVCLLSMPCARRVCRGSPSGGAMLWTSPVLVTEAQVKRIPTRYRQQIALN